MTLASVGILFQTQPAVTTVVDAYVPTISSEITRLVIHNSSSAAASYSLYQRLPGVGAYTNANKLIGPIEVPAGETETIEANAPNTGFGIGLDEVFGVQSSVASALTFTAYGLTANVAQGLGG